MKYVLCAWYTLLMLGCGIASIYMTTLAYRHWEDYVIIAAFGFGSVTVFAGKAYNSLYEKTTSESTGSDEIDPDLLDLLSSIDIHYRTKFLDEMLSVTAQSLKARTVLQDLVTRLDEIIKDNKYVEMMLRTELDKARQALEDK